MSCSTQASAVGLVLLVTFCSISILQVSCYLRPYYIHIPQPIYPPPNTLGPIMDYRRGHWPIHNSSFARSLPGNPVPLVIHTWAKPAGPPEGYKLENGTVIYYVSPPFGGIRAINPTDSPSGPSHPTTPFSNSIEDIDDINKLSPVGMERLGLFEDPSRQSGYASPPGWKPPNIDITTPPPENQGSNRDAHLPNSIALNDKGSEKTTDNPMKQQVTATTSTSTPSAVSSTQPVTVKPVNAKSPSTTESSSSLIETTTSRFPVSDSVKKFRRIVAQIRAIAKKELATESPKKRRG